MKKKPLILGIETSCDETAASVITENEQGFPVILSNIVSSQIDVHKEFGGVVPELAARSHIEKIDLITKKAINDSGIKIEEIKELNQKKVSADLKDIFNYKESDQMQILDKEDYFLIFKNENYRQKIPKLDKDFSSEIKEILNKENRYNYNQKLFSKSLVSQDSLEVNLLW